MTRNQTRPHKIAWALVPLFVLPTLAVVASTTSAQEIVSPVVYSATAIAVCWMGDVDNLIKSVWGSNPLSPTFQVANGLVTSGGQTVGGIAGNLWWTVYNPAWGTLLLAEGTVDSLARQMPSLVDTIHGLKCFVKDVVNGTWAQWVHPHLECWYPGGGPGTTTLVNNAWHAWDGTYAALVSLFSLNLGGVIGGLLYAVPSLPPCV